MGKKSLGRSMATIYNDHSIPEPEVTSHGDSKVQIRSIPVSEIDPNPYQPRRFFQQSEIEELAATITTHGLISPISVRRHDGRYQIIAGERRFKAVQQLGWEVVDARLFDMLSDKSMMEWAIIENIQRVDLNSIEEATSFQTLIQHHGYTHEELASRLGKSRSAISNSLRLLRLPPQIIQWVEEGKLSAGHARSLLSPEITDPESIARKIIEEGLNVRQVEEHTKPSAKKNKPAESAVMDPNLQQLLDEFRYALGSKVQWTDKGKGKGILQIEILDSQDLQRVREIIFLGASSNTGIS